MKHKLLNIASVLIFSFIFIASYIRIFYGVDLTDESFYIALPYRFVLGNLPVIDEYSIYQFAGIITYPLYKLFYIFNSGNDGIVIYSRHLYFIFYSCLGLVTYQALRTQLAWPESLLLASIAILYVPFNIMGLSYNSLATLFFSFGVLFSFLGYQNPGKQFPYFIKSGLFFSLSVFVYPTFAVPFLASLIIVGSLTNYRRTVSAMLLGSLPTLLLAVGIVLLAGPKISNVANYLHSTGITTRHASLFITLVATWLNSIPLLGLILLLAVVLISANFYKRHSPITKQIYYYCALVLPLALLFMYVLLWNSTYNVMSWYYLLINFSLIAPLYAFITKSDFTKKMLLIVWLPSFIAGITTGFSSGNGFINCMIGLLPAFIVSTTIVYLAYQKIVSELVHLKSKTIIGNLIALCMLFAILSCLMVYKFAYVYRDARLESLKITIDEGAYKHLKTSSTNSMVINLVSQDLKHVIEVYQPKNILFYPSFSGGYLLSTLKPDTNSVWLFPRVNNQLTLDFFRETTTTPDVVFIMKPFLVRTNDPLVEFFNTSDYFAWKDRGTYTIYVSKRLFM